MTLALRSLLLFSFFLCSASWGNEVITSYHSEIIILKSGELHVTETIDIIAKGNEIKRGIYRDIPTRYKDNFGNITQVGFTLLSVKRDGNNEAHHSKNQSNGVRIYIGDRNTILKPGNYQYQIEYRTTRQLGFFDEYDELYYNVTGNGWSFPIQRASATVKLPEATNSIINLTGYTGIKGSKQKNLTHNIENSHTFNYVTTQPLKSGEGLTIVANWPKGVITEPTIEQKRDNYIKDNQHILVAISVLGIVFIYYLLIWLNVGKDPKKGIIMPIYQPPKNFSPASVRFISQMKYDKSCLTAAIVNLTVKGFISISQDSSSHFVLSKEGAPSVSLAAGEEAILEQLFINSNKITLTRSKHIRLAKIIKAHKASLHSDYEKLYFMTNRKYFLPGALLSIAGIFFTIKSIPSESVITSTIILGIFTLMPLLMIAHAINKYLQTKSSFTFFSSLLQFVFFIPFVLIGGKIFSQLFQDVSLPVIIFIFLLTSINILFQQWLKAPSLAGRKLLDKVESFKLYLTVAEEDEMKLSGQPEFSSDIYQQFLPFAIALGVDHAWSKKLERSITAGLVQNDYRPHGFHYHNSLHSMTDFSSSLSHSLDSAISSSSTPPGSSSGSSGGGSSGGGGGGGGGGGW